jgi:hypothetical protein
MLSGMWTPVENLRFSVKLGLRRGLRLVRGMRRLLTDDDQEIVARAIVDDLERSNWRFEQGPELEGHGQRITPPRSSS